MASLWRVSVLRKVVQPNLSLWQTEKHGARLTREYGDRFLCVTRERFGLSYSLTAIRDGYWTEHAYRYAREEGIQVDFDLLTRPALAKRLFNLLRDFLYRRKRKLARAIQILTIRSGVRSTLASKKKESGGS